METTNIKISVITVCYNAVDIIEDTIKSIIGQENANLEYIIIDGGSNDGTLEVINKYCNKITQFVSEPDKGIYDAMNKGTSYAKGDFLIFMNAGDQFSSSDVLERFCKSIFKKNAVYYGDVTYKYSSTQVIYGGKFTKYRLTYENICHQSIFYPSKIFKSIQYNTKFRILADWELNIKLWNQYKYIYIPVNISMYKKGGISDTSIDKEFNRCHRSLIFKYLGFCSLFFNIMKSIIFKVKAYG